MASYLENHEDVVHLLEDDTEKENIKKAIFSEEKKNLNNEEGEFISKFSNMNKDEKNKNMINKLFEILPNLKLLKGLEEGRQFKEDITKSIDYIKDRQKTIAGKLQEKPKFFVQRKDEKRSQTTQGNKTIGGSVPH